MKIAIVAPSPVPFIRGGAEFLYEGMHDAINKYSSHQCELIKIPVKEDNFWNIIDSYYKFYRLDLSYFDLIISTKYPSWMVSHKNHILYMLHPLRGLYDTYNSELYGLEVPTDLRQGIVIDILNLIETNSSIELVFEKLFTLKKVQHEYPPILFSFPGIFIRKIIHFFDKSALSSNKITRYCTMSNTVKNRENYFPTDVKVDVIYPPPKIDTFNSEEYNYLFTASRLDSPKRIDLLIKSMKFIPDNVILKIAGEGPEKEKLMLLAANDPRIEFLGFVNESELIDLYSRALSVIFIPLDEDYGYITIESMMSLKPVITASDSGGPLEFVFNEKTGFIVSPDPEEIAHAISKLLDNPKKAKNMGLAAKQKVSNISWSNFVSQLIDATIYTKKKITVLVPYSCYPTRGGGQQRLYNVYSHLARFFDITICSLVEIEKKMHYLTLQNGLKQIAIPESQKSADIRLNGKNNTNLYDIILIDHAKDSLEYVNQARALVDDSDIVVFTHPFLYSLKPFLNLTNKIIVYESQNVEYLLKKNYVDKKSLGKVFEIEKQISQDCDVIFTTSKEDMDNLVNVYNIKDEKIFVTPNGVDTSKIKIIDTVEKENMKKEMKLDLKSTILFIGSWHPPNFEALDFIIEKIAKIYPQYIFLILGGINEYYIQKSKTIPRNVYTFGIVSEQEKYEIYKLADIAINPMFSGSGTNLKMLDYMSAGIPIVSTHIGSRGLDIVNKEHALVCEPEFFITNLIDLINNVNLQNKLRLNARKLVEENYSWEIIAHFIKMKLMEFV